MRGIPDEQCHLMVRTMESWMLADVETLQNYYGQGFKASAIPRNPDVEAIEKSTVASALESATRQTQKGRYHKIQHGPAILGRLDTRKVRSASAHCERLFRILKQRIG
jgi:hypothetical protein